MSKKNNALFTISPVSEEFLNIFKSHFNLKDDNLSLIDLSTLRRLSIKDLLKTLRSFKFKSLYIVYEEERAKSLISILCCVSALTKSKKILIVDPNLKLKIFYRFQILFSIINLIIGTLISHFNLIYCITELKILKLKSKIQPKYERLNTVLYLKTNLWFGAQIGGSIGHISGVVNSLINKKNKLFFLSMENPIMVDKSVNFIKIPSINYYGIPQESNLFTFQRLVFKTFLKKISKKKFSFIYSRLSISNYSNVLISRYLKIPLILEYNGSEVWVSDKWGSGLRYRSVALECENTCLKHAHLIVVVSEVLKNELLQRGIEENKIVYYPNCIDPKVFDSSRFSIIERISTRKTYNLNKDHKIFTFIGTFGAWHGAEKFAEAIKYLCFNDKKFLDKYKIHFMLIGNGLKMIDVKNLIDNDICKPYVSLTGLIPQDKAPIHLAMSDILVSPHVPNADGSKFFGSPTKLFEYMVMGKPIIASDLDQIGEVLKNSLKINKVDKNNQSINGDELSLLVEPGSVNDLVNSIKFLAQNDDLCKMLGNNVKEEALKKYTWDIHVSKIMNSYNAVFSNN